MIKKILSLLLCLAVMTCMCLPAMAEEETSPPAEVSSEAGEASAPEQETQPEPTAQEPEKQTEPEPEPEPPVMDPVRMTASDTPKVKAGEGVKFDVKFTAEEGYTIDSVEMVTSTDINMFPFDITLSTYKVFYGKSEAVYPFDLKARAEAAGGYYKIPVTVNYIGPSGGNSVQFSIPVYVEAEKKEEEPQKQPETTRPLPRVIVSAVSTDPIEIVPGQEFELTLTLKNTSNSDLVKNMEITVMPQGGSFTSAAGTTSTYLSYISAGSSKSISMSMIPKVDLGPGVYNIDVRMAYDTSVNNAFSSSNETVMLTVSQAPQVKVAAIETNPYGGAYAGESISLRSAVYNVGKTPIYNVFATFSSKDGIISSKEVFLGNIEAGGTGDISTYVSALNVGTTAIQLNVRYEDGSGAAYTQQSEVSYGITEKQKNSSDILPEPEDDKGNVLKWVSLGVVAAAAAAGGFVLYRRRKGSETEDIEE